MQKILISILLAWTLSVDTTECRTAANAVIGCANPQAVTQVIGYTIRNDADAIIETGSVTVQVPFIPEGMRGTLRHLLWQKKYPPPPPPPPVTPGTTISIP